MAESPAKRSKRRKRSSLKLSETSQKQSEKSQATQSPRNSGAKIPEKTHKDRIPRSPIKMEYHNEGELLLATEGFNADGKPNPNLRRSLSTPDDIAGAFITSFNEIEDAAAEDPENDNLGLTNWGKKNPSAFYNVIARLAPKQQETKTTGVHTIRHVLPRSPLDD